MRYTPPTSPEKGYDMYESVKQSTLIILILLTLGIFQPALSVQQEISLGNGSYAITGSSIVIVNIGDNGLNIRVLTPTATLASINDELPNAYMKILDVDYSRGNIQVLIYINLLVSRILAVYEYGVQGGHLKRIYIKAVDIGNITPLTANMIDGRILLISRQSKMYAIDPENDKIHYIYMLGNATNIMVKDLDTPLIVVGEGRYSSIYTMQDDTLMKIYTVEGVINDVDLDKENMYIVIYDNGTRTSKILSINMDTGVAEPLSNLKNTYITSIKGIGRKIIYAIYNTGNTTINELDLDENKTYILARINRVVAGIDYLPNTKTLILLTINKTLIPIDLGKLELSKKPVKQVNTVTTQTKSTLNTSRNTVNTITVREVDTKYIRVMEATTIILITLIIIITYNMARRRKRG